MDNEFNNQNADAKSDLETHLLHSNHKKLPLRSKISKVTLSWQPLPILKAPNSPEGYSVECSSRRSFAVSGFDLPQGKEACNLLRLNPSKQKHIQMAFFRDSNIKGGLFSYILSYNPKNHLSQRICLKVSKSAASEDDLELVDLDSQSVRSLLLAIRNSSLPDIFDLEQPLQVSYCHKSFTYIFKYFQNQQQIETLYIEIGSELFRVPSTIKKDIVLSLLDASLLQPARLYVVSGESPKVRSLLLNTFLSNLESICRSAVEDLLQSEKSSNQVTWILLNLLDLKIQWFSLVNDLLFLPIKQEISKLQGFKLPEIQKLLEIIWQEMDHQDTLKKLKNKLWSFEFQNQNRDVPNTSCEPNIPLDMLKESPVQNKMVTEQTKPAELPRLLTQDEMKTYIKQKRKELGWLDSTPIPDYVEINYEADRYLDEDHQSWKHRTSQVQSSQNLISHDISHLREEVPQSDLDCISLDELIGKVCNALSRSSTSLESIMFGAEGIYLAPYTRWLLEQLEKSSWYSKQFVPDLCSANKTKLKICNQIIRAGLHFGDNRPFFEKQLLTASQVAYYASDNSAPDELMAIQGFGRESRFLSRTEEERSRYQYRFLVTVSTRTYLIRKSLEDEYYSLCLANKNGEVATLVKYPRLRHQDFPFLYCQGRIFEPGTGSLFDPSSMIIDLNLLTDSGIPKLAHFKSGNDKFLVLDSSNKPQFIASMGPTTCHMLLRYHNMVYLRSIFFGPGVKNRVDHIRELGSPLQTKPGYLLQYAMQTNRLNMWTFESHKQLLIAEILINNQGFRLHTLTAPIEVEGAISNDIQASSIDVHANCCKGSCGASVHRCNHMKPNAIVHMNLIFLLINTSADAFSVFVIQEKSLSIVSAGVSTAMRTRFRGQDPHFELPRFPALMGYNRDILCRKKTGTRSHEYETGCIKIIIRQ